MKACRQNPKVKNLLQRLHQRYYTVDDSTKVAHMLEYHALK